MSELIARWTGFPGKLGPWHVRATDQPSYGTRALCGVYIYSAYNYKTHRTTDAPEVEGKRCRKCQKLAQAVEN